jgi:hypothetical protein
MAPFLVLITSVLRPSRATGLTAISLLTLTTLVRLVTSLLMVSGSRMFPLSTPPQLETVSDCLMEEKEEEEVLAIHPILWTPRRRKLPCLVGGLFCF